MRSCSFDAFHEVSTQNQLRLLEVLIEHQCDLDLFFQRCNALNLGTKIDVLRNIVSSCSSSHCSAPLSQYIVFNVDFSSFPDGLSVGLDSIHLRKSRAFKIIDAIAYDESRARDLSEKSDCFAYLEEFCLEYGQLNPERWQSVCSRLSGSVLNKLALLIENQPSHTVLGELILLNQLLRKTKQIGLPLIQTFLHKTLAHKLEDHWLHESLQLCLQILPKNNSFQIAQFEALQRHQNSKLFPAILCAWKYGFDILQTKISSFLPGHPSSVLDQGCWVLLLNQHGLISTERIMSLLTQGKNLCTQCQSCSFGNLIAALFSEFLAEHILLNLESYLIDVSMTKQFFNAVSDSSKSNSCPDKFLEIRCAIIRNLLNKKQVSILFDEYPLEILKLIRDEMKSRVNLSKADISSIIFLLDDLCCIDSLSFNEESISLSEKISACLLKNCFEDNYSDSSFCSNILRVLYGLVGICPVLCKFLFQDEFFDPLCRILATRNREISDKHLYNILLFFSSLIECCLDNQQNSNVIRQVCKSGLIRTLYSDFLLQGSSEKQRMSLLVSLAIELLALLIDFNNPSMTSVVFGYRFKEKMAFLELVLSFAKKEHEISAESTQDIFKLLLYGLQYPTNIKESQKERYEPIWRFCAESGFFQTKHNELSVLMQNNHDLKDHLESYCRFTRIT